MYYNNFKIWHASNWFDNRISSLYNNTAKPQYYYENANLKGKYYTLQAYSWIADLRSTGAQGNWNDRISSIEVYNTPW